MADEPSSSQGAELPAAEELKPQTDATQPAAGAPGNPAPPPRRRGSYRPSHRATFIGLSVVVLILAINAAVIAFVLKGQAKPASQSSEGQVTVNQDALSKLGVNRTTVGDSGIQLTVNPNAQFKSNLQVGGDVSIGGQLKINGKFSASDGNFTQLEAGKTSLSGLNVNGDGTLSNLALRSSLTVSGASHLQGATTFNSLVTANSGLNVTGNLAVGGTLAVGSFSTNSLIVSHIVTTGSRPSVSRGNVGSSGTVSISGNDAAGTVDVNTGTGCGCSGVVANITFANRYSSTPHVVITPIGNGVTFYIDRSTSGFSIGVNSMTSSTSYAFDYIVEQ